MVSNLRHILYVDDEPHIKEVAQMCLEMMGDFNVTCLSSGEELIQNLESINPDLILLDVMMPEMDGPTTLKTLQSKGLLKVPVVFMTARIQPEEIEQYLQAGAAGVIAKPFDPMKLSDQVTEIWEKINGSR